MKTITVMSSSRNANDPVPVAWPAGRTGQDGDMATRLKNATSPYLLQHADNPVELVALV